MSKKTYNFPKDVWDNILKNIKYNHLLKANYDGNEDTLSIDEKGVRQVLATLHGTLSVRNYDGELWTEEFSKRMAEKDSDATATIGYQFYFLGRVT